MQEHYDAWFESSHASRFMIVAAQVRPTVRSRIPAVVHVDGSARPQAVHRETSPRYWSLLNHFRELTGVPLLVNTSFNRANEPIVHTPANALDDFVASELDVLAIENVLLVKQRDGS
jgi:carbamoyltransferase